MLIKLRWAALLGLLLAIGGASGCCAPCGRWGCGHECCLDQCPSCTDWFDQHCCTGCDPIVRPLQ